MWLDIGKQTVVLWSACLFWFGLAFEICTTFFSMFEKLQPEHMETQWNVRRSVWWKYHRIWDKTTAIQVIKYSQQLWLAAWKQLILQWFQFDSSQYSSVDKLRRFYRFQSVEAVSWMLLIPPSGKNFLFVHIEIQFDRVNTAFYSYHYI